MAQCSIFVGQMARCNIVVGQMAQCSIFMGQMAQCSIVVGQMAQCSIVVGQMAQCSIFMAQMAQCIVVGQMAQCSIIVGQMAQCSIMGQMAQCSIFMAQMAQCSIFMDQEIFARMTSTTKACFNTYRSKIQIPNSGEVTLWLSMHFFHTSFSVPLFPRPSGQRQRGTHQGTPSDLKRRSSGLRPNIRFCIFEPGQFELPRKPFKLWTSHLSSLYQLTQQTFPANIQTCTKYASTFLHDRTAQLPGQKRGFARGPKTGPSGCPCDIHGLSTETRRSATQPVVILACFRELPRCCRCCHGGCSCGDIMACYPHCMTLVWHRHDARQLLSLLIVKGQTEQTTWVTYITQRGPTFLVREARFGYTVPVITQPLAQFLARQGLLINAVFATAGVRDAFMTLVGVISVDPTGVAAKQLPLPLGARAWPTGGSSRNPRLRSAFQRQDRRSDLCNGVQVRHDICPVVWTMPHPSWCPCQWADTEKELYLGSLLVKALSFRPGQSTLWAQGSRHSWITFGQDSPRSMYLRSASCTAPARPERHSYHPAGVAPRRSTTVCLRVLKGGLAI
ncbi:hypothetical protein PAPYR_9117 [Paratrimastix pyriformis]|uniref:Uncharacterized protein n=1 Tax=Paratrimastix pyriformis TaxID=342808 RepID=A0ABQ8UCQ7_9EUKA|nr:hypothetical protein PAPYR_9117 [Paratrimastix pyriformis]